MHKTVVSDLDFVHRSPFRLEFDIVCFAPAERVFDVLTTDAEFHQWLEPLVEVRWETPAPHRVGSKREIVMDNLAPPGKGRADRPTSLRVRETILAWERGKRFAFSIDAVSLPLVNQMVEDIQLERLGPNKTRLFYRVHYAPTMLMRLVHPLAREFFGKMFRDAVRNIARISARTGLLAEQPRA
jgi:uncharacterized protein YndB with AHSA1/START domain